MMFKQLCRLQRYTFLHELPNVFNTFLHELSLHTYTFLHELRSYSSLLSPSTCLIREKVVTFRMVKLNLLLSIFLITK